MMYGSSFFLLLVAQLAKPAQMRHTVWGLKDFKTLVAFGDSYTDESRLDYFSSHNGSAPPVGWIDPVVCKNVQVFFLRLGREKKHTYIYLIE